MALFHLEAMLFKLQLKLSFLSMADDENVDWRKGIKQYFMVSVLIHFNCLINNVLFVGRFTFTLIYLHSILF